jgi:predicted MFS family arabinose efflux permease
MYWALTAQNAAQNSGFRLSTVGVILMIAGAAGFVVSMIVFIMSRRSPATSSSTVERTTKNEMGDTTELHEQRS